MSPKESGEVGETYEDLLARHPDPTSTPMQLLHSIQSLYNELTPISILQTERYMIPALSPIAGMRVPREVAIGALRCVEGRLKAKEERFRSMLEKMAAQDATAVTLARVDHSRIACVHVCDCYKARNDKALPSG